MGKEGSGGDAALGTAEQDRAAGLLAVPPSSSRPAAAASSAVPLARQHSVARTLFTAAAFYSALPTGAFERISG